MVERLHRTLKAALMSSIKDSNWFTQLPWVFMGLMSTPKDALDILVAEMVNGDPLVIHAEFFPSATSSDDLQRIHHVGGKFTPYQQSYKPKKKHQIPTHLHSATHVILCNNTSKPLLLFPYTGTFLVSRRNPKAFLLNIRGKEDWVPIDRLKPACLQPDDRLTVCLSRPGHPI
ncbi:uncharacterized protein [Palaemon carinicauda]|uniref:uncharacterized protein n=1 Tax=Palaemon carinicauda TaxID=392227 RepID=UPI0035B697EE